jgi:hypothetical protein
MPFKSSKQRKYLYKFEPEIAKKWAREEERKKRRRKRRERALRRLSEGKGEG